MNTMIHKDRRKKTGRQDFAVWVLDDDFMTLKSIEKKLQLGGILVRGFLNPDEFLAAFFTDFKKGILLLIDYQLGTTTGLNVILALQSKGYRPDFIAMTGYGDEKIAVSLMKAGALDYIIKEQGYLEYLPLAVEAAFGHIILKQKLDKATASLERSLKKQKRLNEVIHVKNEQLVVEKSKVEKLLHNILPRKIAKELLKDGFAKARYFPCATVMFVDVVNFSERATLFSPIELVEKLDEYFILFEKVTTGLGLEKIKTIGDCYMCAGGIPESDTRSPARVVLAGLQMQEAARLNNEIALAAGREVFTWRIGIHTGEVVAGVIGKEKFSYDIWGDAANMAYWVEQVSEENMVNISLDCYEYVSKFFDCTARGEQNVADHKTEAMFFANRLKPMYSSDAEGLIPNQLFCDAVGIEKQDISAE